MAEKGGPLPKFGEWDVNDPASAEGFTVIFNKARNEKKTGGKPESPTKEETAFKHGATLGKPQSMAELCGTPSHFKEYLGLR
ncbi:protein NOI4-like isoform X1 [Camellia sinensis]|uniref:protein NOI4-like isoform X1 n=1 Tax=Camellia sinensis TaxID=4442 RepID=UPI0010365FBA|nr:protein NOI4-like isoform X1 [Camellia sinensis]